MSDSSGCPATAIDGRQFRDVLGNFPTSVVAITTTDAEQRPHGMVVGTFTSVSLDPPLVSFLVDRSSTTLRTIRTAGRFCANSLAGNQERLSRQLAGPASKRFDGATWSASALGNPVLDGVVARVDCTLEQCVEIGDHWLVVGRVRDLRVESLKTPLLFFRGGYGDYLASATLVLDRLVGW
ncbi:flavin reductase family protein [Streptomyces turgidiscabies]|uniref:Flavin reductase-like protein n=1 Tax=Streptomyces turgidiscabies (strain Car8) TaxID=698760 RepID=L7F1Z6_STRT8|nr:MULTISPECIES: flavin reductase family protein [Streptomyces]ELP65169.1 flavin reductase-like protein [Streptomyces turgidiscabies Car8]MDX3494585.1 flavin reductase family protein [Streptomyces turgidiscabies]GAQ71192.1 flavin-dependent monooxygenase, reductase subunit [Streptomyces turgidiscabies]